MGKVKIAEGKTKIIWQDPSNSDYVSIQSKDALTAGDGERKEELKGKARFANETTCNCFELLDRRGILTHFIKKMDDFSFQALKCDMIPIELVARRIATGSYLKRWPEVKEGTRFRSPVIEFFLKDDSRHDPLLLFDATSENWLLYQAKKPLSEGFMEIKEGITSRDRRVVTLTYVTILRYHAYQVFRILEDAWSTRLGVTLVDLKIECGFQPGNIVVADVIDNDSWRIWPEGDKTKMKDKQVFRDLPQITDEEMQKIGENYQWVAEATRKFLI